MAAVVTVIVAALSSLLLTTMLSLTNTIQNGVMCFKDLPLASMRSQKDLRTFI